MLHRQTLHKTDELYDMDNERDTETERDYSDEEENDSEFYVDIDDEDDDDTSRVGSYLGDNIPPPLPLCSFEPDEVTNSKPRSIAGYGIRTIDFKKGAISVGSYLHDPLRSRFVPLLVDLPDISIIIILLFHYI